ncbi:hypothetical protein MLD52_21220, partial [Puniceicoccaceae bacterium K14]|nr:hypothetical protein [Puniceicoccaceae bacterium K14]
MKKEIILLTSALSLVGSVFADWTLKDDFESGNVDHWLGNDETDPEAGIPTVFTTAANPAGEGTVGMVDNGDYGNWSFVFDLGDDEIVDNFGQSTLYFRFYRPLVDGLPGDLDLTMGLLSSAEYGGDNPPVINADTEPTWNNYSTIIRSVNQSGIDKFDIYDDNGYVIPNVTPPASGVWYELWTVLDYTGDVPAYKVYIKGGTDYPDQTLLTTEITFENNLRFDNNDAAYRVKTFEALDWINLRYSDGNVDAPKGEDDAFIDDIYVDNDVANLSSPLGSDPEPGEFVNIATRGNVGAGDDVMIAGFVIDGDEAKEVLIQGVGPELGLGGVLADPFLTLVPEAGGDAIVNDNWDS